MVAFETLLLGIITGAGPVRVMVAPPVTVVELRLDGATVGVLHAPPWALECDFGPGPMPHELTAVGRDAAGREVARASQWLNVGRERARVSALLERDPATRQPTAVRLAWETVDPVLPLAVTATLDDAALAVTDPHRIVLPTVTLERPHLLSVEVVFSPQVRDRADLAFGGDVVDRTESELTAVAVIVPARHATLGLDDVQGIVSADGRPATPVGVDEGRAEVALVVDRRVGAALKRDPKAWAWRSGDPVPPAEAPAAAADRFVVVGTVPLTVPDGGRERTYFDVSAERKLAWLSHYPVLAWGSYADAQRSQTIADAVAVAGSHVAASTHRRALVLVLAESATAPDAAPARGDASTYDVGAVRAYLAALGVPLVVWSLTGSDPGPMTRAWGPAVAVADRWEMQRQAKLLEKALAAQRIVWLSGRHLPQRLTLDESRTELRLAR